MDVTDLVLLTPAKADPERDAVARAWQRHGGRVLRLDRFWEPPAFDPATVRLYGNDTFCLVLAQVLRLVLLSPPDDLLARLDPVWTRRRLQVSTLAEVRDAQFPQFIKPLVPKQFRAAVYASTADLDRACTGLDAATPVLVSEVVRFQAEARAFIADAKVATCALYEGEGERLEARRFAAAFARAQRAWLPKAYVLDVGRLSSGAWAVVEANAAWGAGLNGCRPAPAARCIALATQAADSNHHDDEETVALAD